jgi:ribonuclease D
LESCRYIESDTVLNECCAIWAQAEFLAIDTEFIRTDTFYPFAGLLQVGAAGQLYLIDPLKINDWSVFTDLLRCMDIPKVIHSCSEDLEVFQVLFQCVPQPLLDTQIGAALAGLGFGLSYQKLIMDCLGIHVEKGETRSDWLRRPLSESQCTYAALDVLYLQKAYPLLKQRLEEKGAFNWWLEDCAAITAQAETPASPQDYYQRIKSLWKLGQRQQFALQQLCAWREMEARDRNIPRGRVIKDPVCFEIARQMPSDLSQLGRIKDLSPGSVRRYGELLLQIVNDTRQVADTELPEPAPKPLTPAQTQLLKRMRSVGETAALAVNVAPELLLKKRDLEELIRSGTLPEALCGWREHIVGEGLLRLSEEK